MAYTQKSGERNEVTEKFYSQLACVEDDDLSRSCHGGKSMICARGRNSGFVVSANKKSKVGKGEEAHLFLHLEDRKGKTVYFNFFPDIKLPEEAFERLEAENFLTDEKLIEFSANSIKSWVTSFLNSIPN
jgi:hypothetical protein